MDIDMTALRSLESEIKSLTRPKATAANEKPSAQLNSDLAGKLAAELADQLQKALGTKVEIQYKSGKGRVEVHFYTDDQLTQIYEKLKN